MMFGAWLGIGVEWGFEGKPSPCMLGIAGRNVMADYWEVDRRN